jgi:hypothetical protein
MFLDYWWPQLWKYVKKFVKSCDVCAQTKNLRYRLRDLLQPLSIHASIWSLISINFIINLSPFNSYDSILVVVDHLTKMVHFILCTKTIIGERTTKLLFDHVYQYHCIPKDIIFDHGSQFVSKFWKQLFELLSVKVKLSLAFHP